jgi:hypothetical protein
MTCRVRRDMWKWLTQRPHQQQQQQQRPSLVTWPLPRRCLQSLCSRTCRRQWHHCDPSPRQTYDRSITEGREEGGKKKKEEISVEMKDDKLQKKASILFFPSCQSMGSQHTPFLYIHSSFFLFFYIIFFHGRSRRPSGRRRGP